MQNRNLNTSLNYLIFTFQFVERQKQCLLETNLAAIVHLFIPHYATHSDKCCFVALIDSGHTVCHYTYESVFVVRIS